MKILTTLLLLSLLSPGPQGQVPLFCNTPGTHLYYERQDLSTGQLLQTTEFDISEVEQDPSGGYRIHYSVLMKKGGKRDMHGGRAALVTEVAANGDVRMDFGASVKAFVLGVFPKAIIKVSGTSALLPADMKPGDTLPDASCRVEVAGIVITVNVDGRQVLRRDRITTPAGTFDCIVVREHKVERVPLNNKDNWEDNWYVPGIGYVCHDVYDRDLNPLAREILVLRH